jgi:hypothetical protein
MEVQVLRKLNKQELIEINGQFFLFENGLISFSFNQETKNQFLNLSDVDFSVKAEEKIARDTAVMVSAFF